MDRINKRHQIFPLILIVVTVLIFINTLNGAFVYDDLSVVVRNDQVKEWKFQYLWGGRSLRTLSLAVDYHFFGDSPKGYHLQNILWHSASVLLLYVVIAKISGDRLVSFISALIFAVHPIHVEAVANIANRKELLCMAFSLLSFYCFLNFIERSGVKRWIWFICSLSGWFLALKSKQVAIILPVSMVMYEFIFLQKERRFITKKPLLLLVFFLLFGLMAAIYIFYSLDFAYIVNIGTLAGYKGNLTFYSVAMTSARAFWTYVRLLFFPLNLSPEHIMNLSSSFADPVTMVSWFALSGLVYLSFYLKRRAPLISFGLFWVIIHYIPVSNLIPSVYIVADRYMYIPSAGFCLILASFGQTVYYNLSNKYIVGDKQIFFIILITMLLLLYSMKTIAYNIVWLDDKTLWNYALRVTPQSAKAYKMRGDDYFHSGDLDNALKSFNKAIEINPMASDPDLFNNRGIVYDRLGYYEEALRDYGIAIELRRQSGQYEESYYNRGITYSKIGKHTEALNDFNMAIKLRPKYTQAYSSRGNVYYSLGDYRKAIEDYTKAISLDPRYVDAFNNRGYVYYLSGDVQQSINDLNKAIALNPQYADAYYNLGLVYSQSGRRGLALFNYRKAAGLGSKEAQDYLNESGGSSE